MRGAEFWYGLLKVLSFIAAGAFGALGLLTRYKGEDGRVTKAGKVALGGILLSSLLSLSMFILETIRAKEAAQRAKAEASATAKLLESILVSARMTIAQQRTTLAQTQGLATRLEQTADLQRANLKKADRMTAGMQHSLEVQDALQKGNWQILSGVEHTVSKQAEVMDLALTTLRDTQRLLRPIDALEMRVHLAIPRAIPGVSEYLSLVGETFDPMWNHMNQLSNWDVIGAEKIAALGLLTSMPGAIGVPPASRFHPTVVVSDRFGAVIAIHAIELVFYHKHIDPALFSPFDKRTVQPFRADIRATLTPKSHGELLLYYLGSNHDLELSGELISDPAGWMLSGDVVSVDDLDGSQVFITLGHAGRVVSEYEVDRFPERAKFVFSTVSLRIAKQDIVIDGSLLTQYTARSGVPFWVFTFPGLRRQGLAKPAT